MSIPFHVPLLRGSRVHLRPIEPRDVGALFETFGDPTAMRFWSGPPWTEIAQAEALLETDKVALDAGEAIRFGIARDDGPIVGCVSLHGFHVGSRRAELGYVLHRAAWGQGYAAEAVGLALDHAFRTLRLHRVEADTDPRNDRSVALLVRLGFTLEGVLRERWIVGGEISDTALYGLLDREWRRGSPA